MVSKQSAEKYLVTDDKLSAIIENGNYNFVPWISFDREIASVNDSRNFRLFSKNRRFLLNSLNFLPSKHFRSLALSQYLFNKLQTAGRKVHILVSLIHWPPFNWTGILNLHAFDRDP